MIALTLCFTFIISIAACSSKESLFLTTNEWAYYDATIGEAETLSFMDDGSFSITVNVASLLAIPIYMIHGDTTVKTRLHI